MSHSFSRRNLLQNIAIGLLLCSAVSLFVQAQLYTLGETPESYFSQLFDPVIATNAESSFQSTQLGAPVALAVSGSFGRYGSPHISTQDEDFSPFITLFAEALTSLPSTATSTTAYGFRQATDSMSIYLDFQVALPCNIIAGMVGVSDSPNQTIMRRLTLSPHDDGTIHLYWWDGANTYAHATTAVPTDTFYAALDSYQAEDVFFAFEGQAISSHLSDLDLFSLFTVETPTHPQLSATTPTWDETTLLTQLGFNPYTNARYVETTGTEVIIQEDDRVSLLVDGTVMYLSDGTAHQLTLPLTQDNPSAYALSSASSTLIHSLFGTMSGDATLSITSYTQTGSQTQITFDYQINGVPIALSHGEPAASITLDGVVVTQLILRPRQYYTNDATSLLLPLSQACAVVTSDTTLSLSYVDNSTENLSIMWIYQ